MLQIRTVLCPVDFTEESFRELDLATEVCRSFGARLVLHHNVGNAPGGTAASWMWHQEHRNGHSPEEMATRQLRELLEVLPPDVQPQGRLSSGVAAPSILHLEDELGADLVVMATHGASSSDHTSIAEQILERSRCPVLVLHGDSDRMLHLSPSVSRIFDVLVPTDLTPAAERAVSYAFELARVLPVRLHLLHVLIPRKSAWVETGVSMGEPQVREGQPSEEIRERLAALVPEDIENRVRLHVEIGDPTEKIEEISNHLKVSCIIMGAHARSFLRKIFTRDTSLEVLHKAACPVWFVPEAQAA